MEASLSDNSRIRGFITVNIVLYELDYLDNLYLGITRGGLSYSLTFGTIRGCFESLVTMEYR